MSNGNYSGINRCKICNRATAGPCDLLCPAKGCLKMHKKHLEVRQKDMRAMGEKMQKEILRSIKKEWEKLYFSREFG